MASVRSKAAALVSVAGIPALWTSFALWMAQDWRADPFDPLRHGTEAYFHNHEAALVHGLSLTLLEATAVLLILRPWSYRRSWGRSLSAVIVVLPWTAFWGMSLMHAGGIVVIHFVWLVALLAVTSIAAVWSGVAARRSHAASAAGQREASEGPESGRT